MQLIILSISLKLRRRWWNKMNNEELTAMVKEEKVRELAQEFEIYDNDEEDDEMGEDEDE